MTIVNKNNNNKLGRLPREKTEQNDVIFAMNNDIRINVVFATPAGNKVSLNTPLNIKVYDLLCQYVARVNLGPNVIGNGIYFLYDGRKLKKNDFVKLVKELFNDNTNIIVIDERGLIAAFNLTFQ